MSDDVVALLGEALGPGDERELRARARRAADASVVLTGRVQNRLVAAACLGMHGDTGRLVAIAVAFDVRGRGYGRSLVDALPSLLEITELEAETDIDAVGFYRAVGFTVRSIGEKFPGVERFVCRRRW